MRPSFANRCLRGSPIDPMHAKMDQLQIGIPDAAHAPGRRNDRGLVSFSWSVASHRRVARGKFRPGERSVACAEGATALHLAAERAAPLQGPPLGVVL